MNVMYSESADVYDLIYSSFKNYDAESAQLAALIETARPGSRRVLDVACGTGEHARRLAARGFDVDGLDLDPEFVRIAGEKLPGGTVHQGDMADFTLPGRYDVILCLFSSIGYVRSLDGVRDTLACFRRHLLDGGVVIVEPWFTPGSMKSGYVVLNTATGEKVTVARMSHTDVKGALSILRFEYLIGRPDGIRHAGEVHELGLFSVDEMLACFTHAGLTAEYDPNGPSGRGLYTARVS